MVSMTSNFCLAKNRQGNPCKRRKVLGKKRCHMHGAYAGAPKGSQNALKHGRFTKAAIAKRKETTELMRLFRKMKKAYNL
jgi:hypothetical protein